MGRLTVFLVFAWATLVWADSGSLNGLAGRYPILSDNGDTDATGTVLIQSEGERVGVSVDALAMASIPVKARQYMSPRSETRFDALNDGVEQRWEVGGRSLVIRYLTSAGVVKVEIQACGEGFGCAQEHLTLGAGGSSGEAVDAKSFLETRKGNYKILKAGGYAPKPTNETALVQPADTEATITLPFCPQGDTFCDPGFLFVTYTDTRVFKRQSAAGEPVYDIVIREEGISRYYIWTERASAILVRNLQYDFKGTPVCLEHELARKR